MFPNDDEKLWPGEFVNAHVLIGTRSNAVVVPSAAIQRGPTGLFLWTVSANNLAQPRPIEAGPTYRDLTVVASGLNGGEHIVTDGQYKLQKDAPVTVTSTQAAKSGESS
jgi:multidrug efflux system membrane fusion protein